MLIALHLVAALAGQAAPEAAAAPRIETEVRVVTVGGEHGPGRMDKDSDGFVSRDEFTAPMAEAFARLDTDGDGRISAGEFAAGHAPGGAGDHMMMMMHGPGAPGMAGPGPHRFEMRMPGGGADRGGEHEVMVFRGGPGGEHGPGDMDKDGDGKVSEEEFVAPLREVFRRMDADRSGALEAGEHDEHGDGPGVHIITRRESRRAD